MSGKKSQIDISLTIGSIVIPVVVLLGALIFSWAMISATTNAGKMAGVLIYDMGSMVELAYSVPDDIKLNYKPVSMCYFASDKYTGIGSDFISCFNGFMNLSTDISPEILTKPVEFPLVNASTGEVYQSSGNWITPTSAGVGTGDNEAYRTERYKTYPYQVDYPTKLIIKTGFYLPDSVAGTEGMTFPVSLQFSAFADPMDYYIRFFDDFQVISVQHPLVFTIDKAVVFEKQRYALFDTLLPKEKLVNFYTNNNVWSSHDPLEEMVRVSNSECISPDSTPPAHIYFPPNYYFKLSTPGNLLCLYKASIFSNLAVNYKDCESTSIYPCRGYTETQIYCFDFDDIPSGCTYDFSGIAAGTLGSWNITEPAHPNGVFYDVTPKKTDSTITYTYTEQESI